MKNMIISALLTVTLILSVFVLASCSEAEPLPEGVSELPDLDASELAESSAVEGSERVAATLEDAYIHALGGVKR